MTEATMQEVDIDVYRERAVNKYMQIFKDDQAARSLEEIVFGVCQESFPNDGSALFKRAYLHKVRQIADNLDPSSYISNPKLLTRVKDKELTYEELARATPQQLHPDNWRRLIDEKKRRDEIQYSSTAQAMTDKYTCRKCGSKKITYYDLQIRSADEGFTTFFTCLGCGGKWKKN